MRSGDDHHPMKRLSVLVVSVGLVLAACGSDDAATVEDQWARQSAPTQTLGAVYFDLTVAEDDTLVGASVPSDVAAEAQVHEVVMAVDGDSDDMSDEMSGDMDMSEEASGEMDDMEASEGSGDMEMSGETSEMGGMDGAMRMQEMEDGLPLKGGETVTLEPGSYHVMLLDLAAPLVIGDQFEVTLDFAIADDVTFDVEVAETAP